MYWKFELYSLVLHLQNIMFLNWKWLRELFKWCFEIRTSIIILYGIDLLLESQVVIGGTAVFFGTLAHMHIYPEWWDIKCPETVTATEGHFTAYFLNTHKSYTHTHTLACWYTHCHTVHIRTLYSLYLHIFTSDSLPCLKLDPSFLRFRGVFMPLENNSKNKLTCHF